LAFYFPHIHSNRFVKTDVTPAVLAVTEMVWTPSYSHAVFHNEEKGYVKLSFV